MEEARVVIGPSLYHSPTDAAKLQETICQLMDVRCSGNCLGRADFGRGLGLLGRTGDLPWPAAIPDQDPVLPKR